MWTSRTKQSISSPRSSAVLKAMTVGSVVRRISRMARSLKSAPAEVESQAAMNTTARAETPFEELQATLAEDMAAVNALIRERMASEHAPRIPEVTAHLVEAGGKRLRPLLTLAAARLCGYDGEHHVRLAATVEFIHTATLLARRRGRRERAAARAADGEPALGQQVERAGRGLPVRPRLPADGRDRVDLRVLDILANASAVIAEGEVLQLTAASNLATDRGDLPAGGARQDRGALRGGDRGRRRDRRRAGGRRCGRCATYGDALGISFQIADDLLDYGGVSATLGKNTGDDFRERKMTLPVIRALAAADAGERGVLGAGDRQGRAARRRPRRGDGADGAARQPREHARDGARARRAARAALAPLPGGRIKEQLAALADFVVARLS